MSTFSNGFWLGLGCALLFAPMPGQDMRLLLKERFQQLGGALPEREQLNQFVQQASQSIDSVKESAQQVAAKVTTRPESSAQPLERSAVAAQNPLASPSVLEQIPPQEHLFSQGAGISEELQARFLTEGISNIEQLIRSTSTKEERTELAQRVGLSVQSLKTLVNQADFSRLQGIGEKETLLLEAAGVNGSKDLRRRNPEHLHTKLLEVQDSQHILARTPDLDEVAMWIAEAIEITAQE